MKLLGPGTRVAWIGDSHTEALGPRMERMLPAQLGVTFVRPPEARRGWSVRRYVRSGDVPGLVAGAEVVVVELGGNDASAGITPEAHRHDVAMLLEQLGNAQVVWIGPGVTTRDDIEAVRAGIREAQRDVVTSRGGMWVDAQPLTRTGELRSDQIHFTATGYERWAQRLVPVLAEITSPSSSSAPWVGPVIFGAALLLSAGLLWRRFR